MTADKLALPCPVCQRPTGDHTLREWNACLGTPSELLEHEDAPDAVPFLLDGRPLAMADHVTARALVADLGKQPPGRLPVILLTFAVGRPPGPPEQVAEVAVVGTPSMVRAIGRLVRDTANGAANKAERR